jgi:LacI family transcriptional regulator
MKRPTQRDVARKAGVSRATVSYVVNGLTKGRVPISNETRLRVLKAVEELGYEPDTRAQSLRSGDTKTIGLIIPDIRNPHFWENADGVEQEAHAAGYHLLLSSMDLSAEYGEDIFKNLSGRRIDGLILMGSFIDSSEEAKKTLVGVLKRRLPIVEISDRPNVNHNVDSVVSDYCAVTVEAMTHLLSLQHRRIGLIYGVAMPELGVDRLHPYQECLQAAGLQVNQGLIIHCGPTIEDGYQAGIQLLKGSERPTAIIAINDLLAMGVLRAAGDLGLHIPADLSLISYDDIPQAKYLIPRLTTASKDAVRLGREAVRLLLERIRDPGRPRQIIDIPARFIIRESTGPAPVTKAGSEEVNSKKIMEMQ